MGTAHRGMTRRGKRKKKKQTSRRFLWLLLIPAVIALIFGIIYFSDAQENWEEPSYLYRTYPRKYKPLVELYAEKWDVPTSVIYAVIINESGFQADAVSAANAYGLMQLTEYTYSWLYTLRPDEECDPDTITIPSYNVDAGTQLLAWLYDYYGRWDYTYAAYNAGIGKVNGWLEDESLLTDGELLEYPINETNVYVSRVIETEKIYRQLYGGDDEED